MRKYSISFPERALTSLQGMPIVLLAEAGSEEDAAVCIKRCLIDSASADQLVS